MAYCALTVVCFRRNERRILEPRLELVLNLEQSHNREEWARADPGGLVLARSTAFVACLSN